MSKQKKSDKQTKEKPPAMAVVTLRVPDHLRKAADDFIEQGDLRDRSALVRLAVATYIGKPELAKQSKEAA